MTALESLTMFLSFLFCICLTINSVILIKDLSIGTTQIEPWQRGLAARLITLLLMWTIWLVMITNYLPWHGAEKTTANNTVTAVENTNE